jgi:N-acetylmuramoyl-L-alanine amidase
MPSRYFRAFAIAAAFSAVVSAVPSIDSVVTPSLGQAGRLSVVELDLAGVNADSISSLPSPDSVPVLDAPSAATATAAPVAGSMTNGRLSQEGRASDTGQADIQPASFNTSASAESHRPKTPHPVVLTGKLDTKPFTVLGVTWDRTAGLGDVVIRYRVRESGTWTRWSGATASDAAPDPGTADAKAATRGGTDPIVAISGNGLQIWAETSSGTLSGVKAMLVDPGADPVAANATNASFQTAAAVPGQPSIISRAGWGANESLKRCSPDYSNSVVSAAIHHTASTNSYTAADVPGIIRGIYAYHTSGLGWCDIGYNFLVDKFGRIFEGRAGGITSTVIGAHTGGFNSGTIGVSAIGEYGAVAAPPVMVESISQLIAWKFSVHRIVAGASVRMVSAGGESKYPAGTAVIFPTIYGHRDAGLTACPGQHLYDLLPAIRARVASLANAAVSVSPLGRVDAYAGVSSGVSIRGWAFDPESTASITVQASIDGALHTLSANMSRPDVGRVYGKGDNHGFSAVLAASNGRHVVCVSAVNLGQGRSTVLGCQWVTMQNATPIGRLDQASTTPTSITLRGWALDPDTTTSIAVHVYVDGRFAVALAATDSRPDVGRVYGRGDNHGFSGTVNAAVGTHQVCVYAIDSAGGTNPRFGCSTVSVANHPPIGQLDQVSTTPTSITLRGWALDPDTTTSIAVHVYVDGRFAVALAATDSRTDVGRVYRLGDNHGFNGTLATSKGAHTLCLYLINTPTGANPVLTCRAVTT